MNPDHWPLEILSNGELSPVHSGAVTLQYYFVCRTQHVPTNKEASEEARWKVNFSNFTKPSGDLFDGDTTTVELAAGLVHDRRGGWFLVVPVVDRIAGRCGITRDGVIFVQRNLFTTKLGDGLVRCKYKHPNPDGDPEQDNYFDSDMTLIGFPTSSAAQGSGRIERADSK